MVYCMNDNTEINSKEDIGDVWDEHLKCEFETHDVEATMKTNMINGVYLLYNTLIFYYVVY